ncbi:MAG: FAD-dependent oxidoreductase [Clostridiales bacterium]|nr:FAD-dependent oxidoreductase [Clostridiales bacterium]MCF8022603.1 FAD-dependent oxidoreductase [Clostridiales bacterium]
MSNKVVIVGGVAGGASAAARLRRLDENAEIIILERGNYISFASCGLPYYLSETIEERDNLLVQTVDDMQKRFNIEIRVNNEVTRILKEKKEIEVYSNGQIYTESYDYLILSPGAEPVVPSIPGIDKQGIYTLKTIEDVDAIKNHINAGIKGQAAVIGGGYIGIEAAENLKKAGMDVVVIEKAKQVLGPLDADMARIVEQHIMQNDIKLILNEVVERIEGEDNLDIILSSGNKINVRLIILAMGVNPETRIARDAGLEIGDSGGIRIDQYLKTSDPYIYAVGDAVEEKDIIGNNYTLTPLAGPANKQGRTAANNICGRNAEYKGSQKSSIVKVFDLQAAATGNNEKNLVQKDIKYLKSYTHSGSHAGYYPGSLMMAVKMLFTPEKGKILGAQIVGQKGIDKRIDVLALAIRHGMTVFDLEEFEQAYAPPYNSAKDPVNMAGFTASNIIKGDVKTVYWEDIHEKFNENEYVLLDVRTEDEYEESHIEGSVNIPVDNIRERIKEIPADKKLLIYCKIGLRAYIAYRILSQRGYEAYNLSGGYDTYLAEKYKFGEGLDLNEHMTKFEKKYYKVAADKHMPELYFYQPGQPGELTGKMDENLLI